MKIAIILVLVTFVYSTTCATTAQPASTIGPSTAGPVIDGNKRKLMDRAQQLETKAEKQIKALIAAGKTSAADALKVEEDSLKQLIKVLEMTSNSDHKQLKLMEELVEKAEDFLKDFLEKEKDLIKGDDD